MSISSFDIYQNNYQDEVQKSISFTGLKHDFFIKSKATHLISIYKKHGITPSEKANVLDVGCGVGLIDQYLKGAFGSLNGVDSSMGSIVKAAQNSPYAIYKTYDGFTLPYADETFDLTFTINVIHHVEPKHRNNFLKEMKRVTKQNGLVVAFEHNPINPLTQLAVSRCSFDDDAVLISKSLLQTKLQNVGLTIIDYSYILFFPLNHPLLDKLEKWLKRVFLGAQYFIVTKNEKVND
jgi:ubiquinone/menaquinone biosynthesis C-methylase UbiE